MLKNSYEDVLIFGRAVDRVVQSLLKSLIF